MELLTQISEALQQGNEELVHQGTQQAIAEKIPPKKILDDGLIAGMNAIGERFGRHEVFLPDVLMAAKAMVKGMEPLKPLLIRDDVPSLGKVVIGTVQGDLHDIGKNLVGIMLKGAGFEVVDLGKSVSPEKFIDAAVNENAEIIGMSALLTTTMSVMKKVTELRKQKNLQGKIKIVVGGAPVTKEFATEIGADGYAFDAANSVACVKQLMGHA
ncbi:MAG: corrinoid protein [Deltaproteobacteria bacterium]|nr:corrinoid protein [Deltaproteobacteria bacterium]